MLCPRCQHENRPQATLCEECTGPLREASPATRSNTAPKSEVDSLRQALTEAVEQQKATAELLQTRNRELTEAQEQQAATSEILRVIATSPTDVQPVFAAVLMSAARLCDAFDASIFQVDGDALRLVAHEGPIPSHPVGEFPLIRGTTVGRAVLDRRTIHVPDLQAEVDEYPEASFFARSFGFRTTLSVPLLRGTEAIGVIAIRRTEVRPFTDRQIELLQTFAAQAVIAIENVRLFQELEARNRDLTEALEQQTATSEVLKLISRSTFDVQAILDTLIESAVRLCGAEHGHIYRFDGELLQRAAGYGSSPEHAELRRRRPVRLWRGSIVGRAALERRVVHVPDVLADAEFGEIEAQRVAGLRTSLSVPLLKGDELIGVLAIWRTDVQPFNDKQIGLVTTFADQAVIAIENVRLFTELRQKNQALTTAHAQVTEALEQQTATAEILRVIASSPTDLQSALDAVAERAARLCESSDAIVFRVHGDELRPAAVHGAIGAVSNAISPGFVTGRAVLERRTIHVEDLAAAVAADFPDAAEHQRRFGHRTTLATPLLREGVPIGAITIRRLEVRPFTEGQVRLLETFADQAVIAIENVRLFNETKEALEQQTATADILRVIARSPTDLQPVMEAVAENAARVCGAPDSSIYRLEGERLRLVARRGSLRRATGDRRYRSRPSRRLAGTAGRRPADDPRRGHPGGGGGVPGNHIPHAGRPDPSPGHCWRRRCCARARRLVSSSSVGGLRFTPSRPNRSRSSRRSPTRPSSPSRTSACSRNCRRRTARSLTPMPR